MRVHALLFILVMSLTEVAWTDDRKDSDWRDQWETGKQFKFAPEDEFELMWGTSETWQSESSELSKERQPGSDKPKIPKRESWIR